MSYTEFSAIIEPLEVGREILIAELAELGFESFVETEKGLQAYIQTNEFDAASIDQLNITQNQDFSITIELKEIADQNWNQKWEENFDPINIEGKCLVRAPFHEKDPSVTFDIIIDPKMSFGTGHHATTYLMLSELYDLDVEGLEVLDMGCGTAVLAILASFKNAKRIQAIDIDEWAYENSLENIRNNNCDDIEVIKGGAEKITGSFDVILANINRNILLVDMAVYANSLKKGGHLLLSGFFESDVDILMESVAEHGFSLNNKRIRNEWCMLHLKKNDE